MKYKKTNPTKVEINENVCLNEIWLELVKTIQISYLLSSIKKKYFSKIIKKSDFSVKINLFSLPYYKFNMV